MSTLDPLTQLEMQKCDSDRCAKHKCKDQSYSHVESWRFEPTRTDNCVTEVGVTALPPAQLDSDEN